MNRSAMLGMLLLLDGEKSLEPAIAGVAMLEGKTKPFGGLLRLLQKPRILDLRQIDELAVVAEISIAQLGPAVEPEALDDRSIEMADHVVGEEERAELGFHHLLEGLGSGEELVAVRALDCLLYTSDAADERSSVD